MKKDQKFLLKLEENLKGINNKKKDAIILKYRNIIDSEKKENKRIIDILKNLGTPEEIALKEKQELKGNVTIKNIIEKVTNIFKKKAKEEKIKREKKAKKLSKSKRTKALRKIKWNFKQTIIKIKLLFKKKTKTEKVINKIEENAKKSVSNVIEESMEVVSNTKIFETKKQRSKRIIFNTLGIFLILIFIFLFLWASVIFIASAISILDGLKVYGVVIACFGVMLLMLWLVIFMYILIYRKKRKPLAFITSLIVIAFIIALGIGYTINQYYKIVEVDDVSTKYTMTTARETYRIPTNNKLVVEFNSNYKTKYIIDYDESLEDIIKVDVKYYESYYDYYVRKTNNNVYISLELDSRDRLSVYIDDLKDNQIFNPKELSRYSVKITMNENDENRVIFK